MPLVLSSPAFPAGGPIPQRFSCVGQNISPPVAWNVPPGAAQTFALIVDDPDAPTVEPTVHWVLFNLPGDLRELPENQYAFYNILPNGGVQGLNSWGTVGYYGVCPPSGGQPHSYRFTLYAVNGTLALAPTPAVTRAQVDTALSGRILAQAVLRGTFQRY